MASQMVPLGCLVVELGPPCPRPPRPTSSSTSGYRPKRRRASKSSRPEPRPEGRCSQAQARPQSNNHLGPYSLLVMAILLSVLSKTAPVLSGFIPRRGAFPARCQGALRQSSPDTLDTCQQANIKVPRVPSIQDSSCNPFFCLSFDLEKDCAAQVYVPRLHMGFFPEFD